MNAAAAARRAARLPRFRGQTLQMQSFMRHNKSTMRRTLARSTATKRPFTHHRSMHWKRHGSLPRAHQVRRDMRRIYLKERTSSLQWCLSEAIRDAAREAINKAAAISIQLDECHSRLMVKYHACNHDLQVRVGVIALLQNVGKTAPEMAAGVHATVNSICVRRAPDDSCNPGQNGATLSLMMMS